MDIPSYLNCGIFSVLRQLRYQNINSQLCIKHSKSLLGSVYTESQRQFCYDANDNVLIENNTVALD